MSNEWGPGDRFDQFDTVWVEGQLMDLGFGEHPHSRSDNNFYVRSKTGAITGFDGHRVQVKVVVETENYMKESELSGDEVRKTCTATIYLNGVVARVLDGRDPQRMLMASYRALDELFDMGCSVWKDGDELIGRKIYYQHTPAVIERIDAEQAKVFVVPEKPGMFAVPAYAMEDGPDAIRDWLDDYGAGLYVSDRSKDIWWWRK
jgi:hypothetical protein